MKFDKFTVLGTSVSGVATTLTVPEFNLNLDLGVTTDDSLREPTVLLTHGHLDHVHGVIRHSYLRDLMGNAQKARYICAPHLVPLLHDLFRLWSRFQHSKMPEYEVVPVEPGGEVQVGQRLFARPFKTHHRVPCQGYLLVEVRDKLRAEYQGMDGKAVRDLRLKGVQVTEKVDFPVMAYTGDTTVRLFDQGGPFMNVPVLLTECTFMGDEQDPSFAFDRGHVHLDDLAKRAHLFENVGTVVLVHFSQRYTNAFVEEQIARLPDGFREKVRFLRV
mgnify:CR=1 FL=1